MQDSVVELNKIYGQCSPNYTQQEKTRGFNLIDPKDLLFVKGLGDGASADVYLGKWFKPGGGEVTVAIKVLKETIPHKMAEDFSKELKVLKKIKGDLIIEFYGITLRPKFAIVMEFCLRGSLLDVLSKNDWDCTWDRFFHFTRQCVQAVMALHGREGKIVHRDLKSMNFLVTEDWTVKMCDFGLTRQTEAGDLGNGSGINTLTTLKNCRGTYTYTAPEIFNKQTYTPKSDVFSLAIILWEILTRTVTGIYQRPYSSYPQFHMDIQILVAVGTKGIRPPIPEKTPKEIQRLLKGAWDGDPKERKDANFCFSMLNMALSSYRQNKDEWDALRVKAPANGK